MRYAVGIVGRRFAGKSIALEYLSEKRGFRTYTLSAAVKAEAERRGLRLDPRSVLQSLGDELRADHEDPGRFARVTLRKIRSENLAHHTPASAASRIAVGGFKHPREIDVFRRLERFAVLHIDASDDVRFARASDTGMLARELRSLESVGEADRVTFDAHVDERDRQGTVGGEASQWTDGFGQSVDAILEQGFDFCVDNDSVSMDHLYSQLDNIVNELDERYSS